MLETVYSHDIPVTASHTNADLRVFREDTFQRQPEQTEQKSSRGCYLGLQFRGNKIKLQIRQQQPGRWLKNIVKSFSARRKCSGPQAGDKSDRTGPGGGRQGAGGEDQGRVGLPEVVTGPEGMDPTPE
ncbi:hypothetical protein E1301_Tti006384 [Triplophysa tibetana]|uniref:Uncharacterized protein n=1 Tax=Triplophysa tibetana TaxID=1572043 RepID=A0A5A9P209_9TELE|nr:hypothetical protein E1301_Tti006384 [Triplophysa tibetana]